MDIFTFERSAVSLNNYFKEFVLCGIHNCEKSPERIFKRIRPLGIQAENDMMIVTENINTHKGIIFSFGIICSVLGYLYGNEIPYSTEIVMDICCQMCKELMSDFDGITLENAKTHGEQLYASYGIKGVRGEACNGFPTVFLLGVKKLRFFLEQGFSINDSGILTLLHIIANLEDTNIITRSSYETMCNIQLRIKNLIEVQQIENLDYIKIIEELDKEFIKLNISPGGSADMLALSYFIYYFENIFNSL